MTLRTLGLVLLASLACAPALAASKARPRIAVLPVEAVQGVSEGAAKVLTSIVTARAGAGGFDVVSSAEIAAMLSFEKQKQLLGCTEGGCLAEIGGALGVDYLLSSQVGRIGSRFHVSLLLADVRKARVLARQSRLCEASEDVLVDVAQKAVVDLLKPVLEGVPAAPGTQVQVQAAASEHPSYVPPALTSALAVGSLGAAIACGISAKSRYDSLASKQGTTGFQQAFEDEQRGIRQRALAADILYGAAAVSAGISIWLWVRAASPSAPAVSVAATRDGATLAIAGSF